MKDVALIGIHTDPDEAVDEIAALTRVHAAVKRKWRIDDIIIMGDLNADCSYASSSELDDLDIRSDSSKYTWLIDDNVDTTTSKTDCAYDRCVSDRIIGEARTV